MSNKTNKSQRRVKKELKKALNNTTTEQRRATTQKSTVAIESVRRIVDLLRPWELSRTQRYRTYQSMLRDDAIWSSWESRSKLVQEAQHNGKFRYDDNDKQARQLAGFFSHCMKNMDEHTVRSIAAAASEMTINGFAPFEIVTKEGTGEYLGSHALKKLSYISPLTLSNLRPFETEDGGNRITYWNQLRSSFLNSDGTNSAYTTGMKEYQQIDSRKVALCSYSASPSSPICVSPFDAAYTPWREKQLINDFLIMGVQKDMAGMPVLEVPASLLEAAGEAGSAAEATIEALKDQMTNLHAGDQAFMIVPSDTHNDSGTGEKQYNLTFKGVDGNGKNFSLDELITQRNQAIHKALGALNLNSAEQGSASYNSLEGQTNIQYHYVKNDCRIIDEMWNKQVFPLLLRLNGIEVPAEKVPVWEHGQVQDISLEEFGKYIQRTKLYLPQSVQVINRVLEVAGINQTLDESLTREEIAELMPEGVEDRSGESGGTSGNGDDVQSQDDNLENTA